MDWDDEFDDGYYEVENSYHSPRSIDDPTTSDDEMDPCDISNPASAYFF